MNDQTLLESAFYDDGEAKCWYSSDDHGHNSEVYLKIRLCVSAETT